MSYIMQALQRSEEARRMGESPELRTPHPPQPAPKERSRWPLPIIALVILNTVVLGGALIYFNQPSSSPEAPLPTREATTPAKAGPPTVVPKKPPLPTHQQPEPLLETLAPPPKVAPLVSQYQPPQPAQGSRARSASHQGAATADGIPREELSPPLETAPAEIIDPLQPTRVNEIAGIDMSVHVYSPDPEKRFVFINGKRYKEGERLNNGTFLLKAINAQGIIVEHGGKRELLQLEQ